MVISNSVWIVGTSRSGKTTRLVEHLCDWLKTQSLINNAVPKVLVLAVNGENRQRLSDIIITATQGKYSVRTKTLMGFFQDEVILFWPLLVKLLNIPANFPVRLRPEREEELAGKLWKSQLEAYTTISERKNHRLVRRLLDLFQLAAYGGVPCEEIGKFLPREFGENTIGLPLELLTSLLLDWRNWCLAGGLLSYAIITEVYAQNLLSDRSYQQHLSQRYEAILADDVDDYPAVAAKMCNLLLDNGARAWFSYNPDGGVRLGLGADTQYLSTLGNRCQIENLTPLSHLSLAAQLHSPMVDVLQNPMLITTLPAPVKLIQTISRGELLRAAAEEIINSIESKAVAPQDIAIIAPGLDDIARYTLVETLTKANIPLMLLNEQLPLISSPVIRALLTLLTLVYRDLGPLVNKDAVAEMLVILTRTGDGSEIDPVRAGLIADNCFVPSIHHPHLLPVTTFSRWDRIGYQATTAYNRILQWLETHSQPVNVVPTSILYLAIQEFILKEQIPTSAEMAALRELLETAQHYWEIESRLRKSAGIGFSPGETATIEEFILLLRRRTITANPYPVRPLGISSPAVTLATIFQYRSSRKFHRWHFWLDVGSRLWLKGGAASLLGAPLFLRHRLGQVWTVEDEYLLQEGRLSKILGDLLSRVGEKVYLCHSQLAVNGQEQLGRLLSLVYACI